MPFNKLYKYIMGGGLLILSFLLPLFMHASLASADTAVYPSPDSSDHMYPSGDAFPKASYVGVRLYEKYIYYTDTNLNPANTHVFISEELLLNDIGNEHRKATPAAVKFIINGMLDITSNFSLNIEKLDEYCHNNSNAIIIACGSAFFGLLVKFAFQGINPLKKLPYIVLLSLPIVVILYLLIS